MPELGYAVIREGSRYFTADIKYGRKNKRDRNLAGTGVGER